MGLGARVACADRPNLEQKCDSQRAVGQYGEDI